MNDNPKPTKNGFKFPEHSIKTKITDVMPNELVTRGYNQEDLITNLSFAEMVFLLLRERLPDERESKVFNHILVSFCDHGVTPPSTQSARLIASSGANINNAVAGGLLSFGKNHAGAIEKAMELFQESISSLNLEETADEDVNKGRDLCMSAPCMGQSPKHSYRGYRQQCYICEVHCRTHQK